jgi:hypothetical protein
MHFLYLDVKVLRSWPRSATAVAPSWDQIGKLGAIAVIWTTLNYFLMRELRETGQMPAGEAFGLNGLGSATAGRSAIRPARSGRIMVSERANCDVEPSR